ncbi:biotin carboxylase N-terminal domain-containing protein [Nocardioides sp.]|uniref:acetyl/propionyl/methylcrotonyl-CoA carboxylase subunit alpha n=1 Tax=Nocardioides sp. TaxID=35761 RepID=UPI002733F077|nr:biotin carboxylase N-terminal domain-containing protein [Nocardioides sp.]MDP3891384.1 biotin carboxylase N-terminal domain-containing protein [Nocardioides sp.]
MVSTSSTTEPTGSFSTVLVANRGEIALRVMAACRALGLRSVAIYTELDRAAPHVRVADDAVAIGSYLDIDEVVAAARTAGAGAIHPGYGFLSERAELAHAVAEAGLVLVGPSAEVMEQMGRKDAAREIAVAAGVPVVPSYGGPHPPQDAYPVLVKAASGGGGKGMRIVRTPGDFDEAVASARREALSAFGDDTILVEKYVERGRHIEVQVLADHHGNVVHLFERDCSTQRRHQKVLEEAPAPTITEEVRRVATESAVALARQVGYHNAGTVEFLLDSDTGEVYFLEMNTRLQVEHPVTELVTATDLVQLQLRIAQGEPLPFDQDELRLRGHAIEARVYAEDPFSGFLPQAGTATLVSWPERARVDAALETGQVVSTSYDPMLGKVIVHGPDRETARRALVAALDDTAVLGLTTNVGFLRAIAASDEFRDAAIDTAWLDRHTVDAPSPQVARVLAATARTADLGGGSGLPFAPDGWRIGAAPAPVLVELGPAGGSVEPDVVRVDRIPEGVRIDGLDVHVLERTPMWATDGTAHRLIATVGGRRHEAVVAIHPHEIEVVHQGHRHVFHRPDVFADRGAVVGDGTLLAPMPGTVLAVHVTEGQQVSEGEVLGVMEAMKMELALKAPFDGVVSSVGAAVGDQVALGASLFVVDPPAEGSP